MKTKTKIQFPSTNPFHGKSKVEARNLHRRLSNAFHPDKHAAKGKAAEAAAQEKFQQLSQWYAEYKKNPTGSQYNGFRAYYRPEAYTYSNNHRTSSRKPKTKPKTKPKKQVLLFSLLLSWIEEEKAAIKAAKKPRKNGRFTAPAASGSDLFFLFCERNWALLLVLFVPFMLMLYNYFEGLSTAEQEEAVQALLGVLISLVSITALKLFSK